MKLTQAIGKHTRLQWFPITSGNRDGGEILAAFELYLVCENQLDTRISYFFTKWAVVGV